MCGLQRSSFSHVTNSSEHEGPEVTTEGADQLTTHDEDESPPLGAAPSPQPTQYVQWALLEESPDQVGRRRAPPVSRTGATTHSPSDATPHDGGPQR